MEGWQTGRAQCPREVTDVESAKCHRSGTTLRITGSLHQPVDAEFDLSVRALLDEAAEKGAENITVDLREVTYIGSQYLGAIGSLAVEMKRTNGGTVTVYACEHIASLISMTGFDHVLTLVTE